MVWLAEDHLDLTGPCGVAPRLIEVGATDHPVDEVTRTPLLRPPSLDATV